VSPGAVSASPGLGLSPGPAATVGAGSAAQGVLELSMAQASARNAKAAIEVFLRKVMGNLHLREMQSMASGIDACN
jgi:hypothetical protein